MPTAVDSLQQLFQKLLKLPEQEEQQPYLVLIQHSLSFAIRQASTAEDDADEKLYRRAGLRTPAENATRDWEGGHLWLKHITTTLQNDSACLLWLQTSTRILPEWLSRTAARIIDVSSDPWGWDSEESLNLNRLDAIVESLETTVAQLRHSRHENEQSDPFRVPLVVETLTPLLVRHGLTRSIQFLKRMQQIPGVCPLVIPVLTENLTSKQHHLLEDLAQAVLWLHEGEAVLLRQGVREKGNMVRENLNYQIVIDNRGIKKIKVVSDEKDSSRQEQADEVSVEATPSISTSSRKAPQRPKVQLQLEEEAPKKTSTAEAATTPQIYMQDDDPEFEDYDEEDPDDDLEI